MKKQNLCFAVQEKPFTVSFSKAAKILGFPGGEILFAKWLRTQKLVMPDLEPYQVYVKRGYFTFGLKVVNSKGKIVTVTRITLKGLEYIKNKIKNQINN